MARQFIIILNPTAGKGSAKEMIRPISEWLDDHAIDYELHLTERRRHATELAQALSGDPETAIIAAGGDGTANEVINGLMYHWEEEGGRYPVFGILPIGRGNDMSFGAGIPGDWAEALRLMLSAEPIPMDVGRLRGGDYPEGLWFGNGVGVGFDAIVGFEANRMKRIHGPLSYTIAALKTLAIYPKAPVVEITIDGRKETIQPALVSVMNGRRMGGAFFMAPNGTMEDGRLNWCRTSQGSRWNLLTALAAYSKGSQASRSDTDAGTASGIIIRALEGRLAIHADGETVCESGEFVDISVAPGALRLLGSRRV